MSDREESKQANYTGNPLNLSLYEIEYWISRYAKSAAGWLSDGKRNLAESCAYEALRYIAMARVLEIAEVGIDGKPKKIDDLEARMRAQLTMSSG